MPQLVKDFETTLKQDRINVIVCAKKYWNSVGKDLFTKYAKEMKELNITPEDSK